MINYNKIFSKELIIELVVMSILLLLGGVFFSYLYDERIYELGEYPPVTGEYVMTYDMAEIIDEDPQALYCISFDIRAEKDGLVYVYFHNGPEASYSSKYYFSKSINVEKEYSHYEYETYFDIEDINKKEAFLSFYGSFGSGVIPIVKNVNIEKVEL